MEFLSDFEKLFNCINNQRENLVNISGCFFLEKARILKLYTLF